jgi:hypothetical protein
MRVREDLSAARAGDLIEDANASGVLDQ